MAHFGKLYPNSQNQDLGVLYNQGYAAPRKWRIRTSATSVGTYTIPWRSLDLISEMKVWTIGSGVITWDFICPTDSANVIQVRWEFKDWYDPPSITNHWLVKVTAHFNYSGVEIARLDSFDPQGEIFFGADLLWKSFNTWPVSTNRTLVDSQTNLRLSAARWQDDPAFHPYRF